MSKTPSSQSGFYLRFYRDLLAGKIKLPSLPDVAMKVRSAMQKEDYDIPGICKIIQLDAALAAQIIQVANSALYAKAMGSNTLQNAIMRLGINATRNICLSFAVRGLFQKKHSRAKLLSQHWQQSAKVASIAMVLARISPGIDPDRALLAGLLQDIGILPIVQQLEQHNIDVDTDQLIQENSPQMGAALLSHWGFDEEIIEVANSREQWDRDPSPQADLADLILIARLLSYVGTPRMGSCPRINQVPAFNKQQLGELTPEMGLIVLDEAKEELKEIMQLLGAEAK